MLEYLLRGSRGVEERGRHMHDATEASRHRSILLRDEWPHPTRNIEQGLGPTPGERGKPVSETLSRPQARAGPSSSSTCPSWCSGDHLFDDDSAQGGGVTVHHQSERLVWSESHGPVGIYRIAGYAPEDLPASISISGVLHDVTADDARRLARALQQLADELEP